MTTIFTLRKEYINHKSKQEEQQQFWKAELLNRPQKCIFLFVQNIINNIYIFIINKKTFHIKKNYNYYYYIEYIQNKKSKTKHML